MLFSLLCVTITNGGITLNEHFDPIVSCTYYAFIVVVLMFSLSPVIAGCAFLFGLVRLFLAENRHKFFKDLIFFLAIPVIVSVTNPLFSHNGSTPLFFVNEKPYTFEALMYGVTMGIQISSVIIWFTVMGKTLKNSDIMYLIGKALPKTTLVITMVKGYVPKIKDKFKQVSDAQTGNGIYSGNCRTDKIKYYLSVFSCVFSWSAEHSVETSISMNARGFGYFKRTSYKQIKFRLKDLIALLLLAVSGVLLFASASDGISWNYYPVISIPNDTLLSDLLFGAITFSSSMLEIKERIKWKYCLAKI